MDETSNPPQSLHLNLFRAGDRSLGRWGAVHVVPPAAAHCHRPATLPLLYERRISVSVVPGQHTVWGGGVEAQDPPTANVVGPAKQDRQPPKSGAKDSPVCCASERGGDDNLNRPWGHLRGMGGGQVVRKQGDCANGAAGQNC